MKRMTPVIFVEQIEPCLPFWTERLGFTLENEVPMGDVLGFASVRRGPVEVMYQTRASILEDLPAFAQGSFERTGLSLFVEVDDFEEVLRAMDGVEVVVPERTTFYGARELGVRAPCGTLVVFAHFAASPD